MVLRRLEVQKTNLSTVNSSCSTGRVNCHQAPKDAVTDYWFTKSLHKRGLQHQERRCGKPSQGKLVNTFRSSFIKLSAKVPTSMEIMEIFNPVIRLKVFTTESGEAQECLWFAYGILRYVMFTLRVPRREDSIGHWTGNMQLQWKDSVRVSAAWQLHLTFYKPL